MNLEFNVTNQKLQLTNKNYYANESNNYLQCIFNFLTSDWTDKTIFIILKNKEEAFKLPYTGEPIIVPYEAVKDNRFYVMVYGILDDVRITTNQLSLPLKYSGYTTEISNVPEDAPDLIDVLFETKADADHKHVVADITDLSLSEVAYTGEYNDLLNSPTRTSDFINDGDGSNPFLTEHQSLVDYVKNTDSRLSDARTPLAHTHVVNDINDFPIVPTKTSQLSNDSGFLTEHQDLSDYISKKTTNGLLKNDGTVDTTEYISQHQDISMKADKSYVDDLIGDINEYILR